jgi:predicted O-methyltransferase YrrM
MEKGYGQADPKLSDYVDRVFQLDDPVLADIQATADREALPAIQVSRFDGRMLELFARAVNARRAVEIGTLAGYSAVNLIRGLTSDGILYTFEYDPKHAKVAEANLKKHGYLDRARIFVGKARERLPEITTEGPFDLVFIDADKDSYPDYLAWAEVNLRFGGIALIDNAFGFGKVADPKNIAGADPQATAIHETNTRLSNGGRFRAMMLPTEQGLAMGVKIR